MTAALMCRRDHTVLSLTAYRTLAESVRTENDFSAGLRLFQHDGAALAKLPGPNVTILVRGMYK